MPISTLTTGIGHL